METVLNALCTLALTYLFSTALCDVDEGTTCDDRRGSLGESLASGANDVVVVRQPDGKLRSTEFNVQIGKLSNWRTVVKSREGRLLSVEVNGIVNPVKMTLGDTGEACFTRKAPNKFNFTSEELETFNLQPGMNRAMYKIESLRVKIPFVVYLLPRDARLLVTDVDGTITSTDVGGRIYPTFGIKANHDSVVKLIDGAVRNGLHAIYLTGRSMGEDEGLREYLFEKLDNTDGGYSLPFGPVFMAPKTVAAAVLDAATSGVATTKARTMRSLFSLIDLGGEAVEGAFGNLATDVAAYRAAGVPPEKIFEVGERGAVKNAAQGSRTSYREMADDVDAIFPPLGR